MSENFPAISCPAPGFSGDKIDISNVKSVVFLHLSEADAVIVIFPGVFGVPFTEVKL